MIEGIDLNDLIGHRFSINAIQFEGTEESKPCYWMDQVIAPGAEEYMIGHGGLRTKILTDGFITSGEAVLTLLK